MSRIWIVYSEIRSSEFSNGAFLECYVPEDDIVNAICSAKIFLKNMGVSVIDIDKCIEHIEDEWDDDNDPEQEVRGLVKKVHLTQKIQTGIFRAYEKS